MELNGGNGVILHESPIIVMEVSGMEGTTPLAQSSRAPGVLEKWVLIINILTKCLLHKQENTSIKFQYRLSFSTSLSSEEEQRVGAGKWDRDVMDIEEDGNLFYVWPAKPIKLLWVCYDGEEGR